MILKNKTDKKAFTPLEIQQSKTNLRSPKGDLSLTGFTFIELLIVVIIIGILLGVSIPQFRRTFNHLQLSSFSGELQAFMNYLSQRAVVEGEIVYLNIDNEKNEYWAQIKDKSERLKTYPIPDNINLEIIKKTDTDNPQILFYPDGQIDEVTIKVVNPDNRRITLTTEGVFGKAKIQSQE